MLRKRSKRGKIDGTGDKDEHEGKGWALEAALSWVPEVGRTRVPNIAVRGAEGAEPEQPGRLLPPCLSLRSWRAQLRQVSV